MSLTTRDEVKDYLHLEDTKDDEFIQDLVSRISADIETYCNRKFEAADYTEYHSGDGISGEVYLKQLPINSVTSLHDDTERVYGSDTLIDSSDYAIHTAEGYIQLDEGSVFSKGNNNIKVVYNAGYATVPSDVTDAAVKLVAAEYLESQGGIETLRDQESQNRIDRLRNAAYKILDKYILPVSK